MAAACAFSAFIPALQILGLPLRLQLRMTVFGIPWLVVSALAWGLLAYGAGFRRWDLRGKRGLELHFALPLLLWDGLWMTYRVYPAAALTGLQVLDGEGHPVGKTPEMNRILELGGENEHAVMAAWLICADDLWFLQVMLNVNLWTPYELYWYNPVSDRLVEMTTFDGKEVVGLEIADKAYFERMMKIGGE